MSLVAVVITFVSSDTLDGAPIKICHQLKNYMQTRSNADGLGRENEEHFNGKYGK